MGHKHSKSSTYESPTYEYAPVDAKRSQIRLLTIHPGKIGDFVRCSLSTASLSSVLGYEALSYAWGDHARTHFILLDGYSFGVTRSLGIALLFLRQEHSSRTMWIDAICINQNDPKERSEQVLIMRGIYRQASQVVVWLGDHDEPTDHEWKADQDESVMPASMSGLRGDKSTTLIASEVVSEILDLFGEDSRQQIEKLGLSRLYCLYRLLSRPYFSRLWVIQEVAVASACVALVGRTYLNWKDLLLAAFSLATHGKWRIAEPIKQLRKISVIFQIDPRSLGILRLIEMTKYASVSDPRDRVIAVLGLAGDRFWCHFVPDYSKTCKEFFYDFAGHVTGCVTDRDFLLQLMGREAFALLEQRLTSLREEQDDFPTARIA